jgi:diguanylate cyclase (GGDEF)-like protein
MKDKTIRRFEMKEEQNKSASVASDHIIPISAELEDREENDFFFRLFQRSMIGQVVVDKDLSIVFANNRIFQCFQSIRQDSANLSFGDAFGCIELRFNGEKCGAGERCRNCKIWNCVRQVLINDTAVSGSIQYSFHAGHHAASKWFQLSGSQIVLKGRRYALLSFVDISELKKQEADLKVKLTLDLATGAMNKHSLMTALRSMMESESKIGNFTVCMIDFDHFKMLNDQYGHLMGDKVLEVFSDIARCHIRKNDILGRYGGEEFIFVFYETGLKQSLQILRRIHVELEEHFAEAIKIPVTFSAGVIHVEAINGPIQYTDLIADVDKMLYRAKKRGRGRAMSSIGEILFRGAEL